MHRRTVPITYSIDEEHGVINERWTGDIHAADLGAYWKAYLADPRVMEIRRTLVDLRGSTHRFTGKEMSDLVETIVVPAVLGLDWKTAIILDRPHQVGLSRQYHVFAERFSSDATFYEADAALQWLLQQ